MVVTCLVLVIAFFIPLPLSRFIWFQFSVFSRVYFYWLFIWPILWVSFYSSVMFIVDIGILFFALFIILHYFVLFYEYYLSVLFVGGRRVFRCAPLPFSAFFGSFWFSSFLSCFFTYMSSGGPFLVDNYGPSNLSHSAYTFLFFSCFLFLFHLGAHRGTSRSAGGVELLVFHQFA